MFFLQFKRLITFFILATISFTTAAQRNTAQLEEQAGIWLDLVTYYCEQGDQEEAMRLLNIIEFEFSPPPGIKKVIAYLRKDGCQIQRKPSIKLALSSGWSNNVNQGPSVTQFSLGPTQINLELSPRSRPQSDHFIALEGEWYAQQSIDKTWQLILYGHAKQYAQQQDFNQQLLGAAVSKKFQAHQWDWEWRTSTTIATLGSRHFQDSIFTGLFIEKQGWLAESQLGYQQYANYPAYNAQIWINRVGYKYPINARTIIQTRLNHIIDQAIQGRPGGNRAGHGWDITSSYIIDEQLKTDLLVRYDSSRSNELYYPGWFDVKRDQHWSEIRWNWLYLLGANDAVQVQLFYNQVRDSVPILAFKQKGVTLTWAHLFR